jgi:hypothetical protein
MNIAGTAHRNGTPLNIRHIAELLAQAIDNQNAGRGAK